MIIHDGTWMAWMGVFDWMDCSRARTKPICAMFNSLWTTVGGINSCTTDDVWYGVVARYPFPLLIVGNPRDVVEQCGITFLVLPRARTTFNIGERGKGIQLGGQGPAKRGLQTVEVVQE